MIVINRTVSVLLLLLLTISCGARSESDQDELDDTEVRLEAASDAGQTIRIFRGHALHGHEVRSFRPCGSDEALWAIDQGGALWDQYKRLVPHPAPGRELFAVVEAERIPAPSDGFGADYSGALRVESVLYIGLEGPECDLDWKAFRYRVNGNEPFWSVAVTDRNMRLSRLGDEDSSWNEIALESVEGGFRYLGTEGGSTVVELTVMRQPCMDSMSGSYYAFTGTLRIGEEELQGCTLQGQP